MGKKVFFKKKNRRALIKSLYGLCKPSKQLKQAKRRIANKQEKIK
jgi:hypothetical protein